MRRSRALSLIMIVVVLTGCVHGLPMPNFGIGEYHRPPEVALVGQSAEIGGECNEEATFVLHFAVRVPEEGDGKIYISRKALVPQVMAGGGPGSAASDVSVESVGAQAAGGEFVVSSGEEATFTVRVLISVDRLTLAWVQIPELVFRRSRFEEEHSIPVQELKSSILGVDPDC